jgi:hypothetical protein
LIVIFFTVFAGTGLVIDSMKRIGRYTRLYTRTVYKTMHKDGWIDSMKRIGRYTRLYTRTVHKTMHKDGWIDSMKRIAFGC